MRKNILSSFLDRLELESARAPLCKLGPVQTPYLKQQASTIQSRPVKNIRKVGKKEQNDSKCTNLFTCNCKITTDKLFQTPYFTWFQLPSSLRAVKYNWYNFNILVNSQMQCSHVIQTQAQKCDGCALILQKFLKEKSDAYKQLICIMQRVHFQIRVGVFNCQDKDFVSLILW